MQGEKTKLKAKVIGRVEKLISSIKTLHYQETLNAVRGRVPEGYYEGADVDKEFENLLASSCNPIKNEELIQAKAVNIPEFEDDGLVSNPQKAQISHSDFKPLS